MPDPADKALGGHRSLPSELDLFCGLGPFSTDFGLCDLEFHRRVREAQNQLTGHRVERAVYVHRSESGRKC